VLGGREDKEGSDPLPNLLLEKEFMFLLSGGHRGELYYIGKGSTLSACLLPMASRKKKRIDS